MSANKGFKLWDLPTRLFHWGLVVAIPLSWWTAEQGDLDLHQWLGYTLLVMVVGRIIWGFIGSRHSRFSDFLKGPRAILAYMRGDGAESPGHNPMGGWSVVVMLLLILAQAVSGLFNTDDILFSGPLYSQVGVEFRDAMGVVHEVAFNVLLAMVALHICVVLYHQFKLKEKLIQAMIKGRAQGKEGRVATVSVWWAVVMVLMLAAGLWFGLSLIPKPVSIW